MPVKYLRASKKFDLLGEPELLILQILEANQQDGLLFSHKGDVDEFALAFNQREAPNVRSQVLIRLVKLGLIQSEEADFGYHRYKIRPTGQTVLDNFRANQEIIDKSKARDPKPR